MPGAWRPTRAIQPAIQSAVRRPVTWPHDLCCSFGHSLSLFLLCLCSQAVPKQVLKESNESEVEADETEDFEGDINDLYDDELIYKESEAIPKLYSNTSKSAQGNGTAGAGGATRLTGSSSNPEGIQSVTNGSMDADASSDGGSGVNPVMTHSSDLSLEGKSLSSEPSSTELNRSELSAPNVCLHFG